MTDSLLINGNSTFIPLRDKSFHCAIFSTPYFSLRMYQTARWTGGDLACEHIKDKTKTKVSGNPEFNKGRPSREETKLPGYYYADVCGLCGATKKDEQIGLEEIPDCLGWTRGEEPCEICFVCSLRKVFREVYRVLRDDGVCFLNLGDSYASGSGGRNTKSAKQKSNRGTQIESRKAVKNMSKQQLLIPHRVALALQSDGWIVRNDIVWNRINVMPESVKDRFTKSHEYIFLLVKQEKYFFDQFAVAEPLAEASKKRYKTKWNGNSFRGDPNGSSNNLSDYFGSEAAMSATTRNRRTVWSLTSEPSREAHYASFPTKLVEIMLLAGTSQKGACSKCGAQWTRIVERIAHKTNDEQGLKQRVRNAGVQSGGVNGVTLGVTNFIEKTSLGFEPGCSCNVEVVPAIVLDIFCGTGTTGFVAKQNGRRFIGIDLSMKYLSEIAKPRLSKVDVKLL